MVVLSGSWGSFCQHWFGSMHDDHSACVQHVVVCDAGSRVRFPHECRPTRLVIGCVCVCVSVLHRGAVPLWPRAVSCACSRAQSVQCILHVQLHFQHSHHQRMMDCLSCTLIVLRCMLSDFGLVDPFQHALLAHEADRSR